MSILNKYKEWRTQLRLLYDKYFDFVLSLDDEPSIPLDGNMTDKCLSAYIDFNNEKCYEDGKIYSLSGYTYDDAVNSGCELLDIGFTGIDNGFIRYEKDKITNQEFFDIFTGSTYEIKSGDTRLFLTDVTGNTKAYSYDMENITDENDGRYYALKGGFFQGFYKLFGFDYEVLPTKIDEEWNVEVTLRPKDYELKDNSLNSTHPENKGIFFYMGARAENKFAQFYNSDFSSYGDRKLSEDFDKRCDSFMDGDNYFAYNEDGTEVKSYECEKLKEETEKEYYECKDNKINIKSMFMWQYFFNYYGFNEYSECSKCKKLQNISTQEDTEKEVDEYFADDYFSDEKPDCTQEIGYYNSDEYFNPDVNLDGVEITTSEGNSQSETGYFEIETDNKFITFNRTKTGFTTNNFDEDGKIVLTGITHNYTGNMFLDVNRTKTGYTTATIEKLYESASTSYDFVKDMKNNSFALKINDDGSIGYRYMVLDCDSDEGYQIIEEKSYPNIVTKDDWNTINIKFKPLYGSLDKCGNSNGKRGMKLYIYVNGYLKMVSKELPEFNFTELNDTFEKQEGVPYSISLGGGTQGLCDSVWLDYYTPFSKILPIEENFAGTFVGDIKTFRFYTCPLQYNEIKNNYLSLKD